MLRHFFGENGYFWIQTFTRKKNPCMLYTVRFQILSRLSFAKDAKNDMANFDYALTLKKLRYEIFAVCLKHIYLRLMLLKYTCKFWKTNKKHL